MIAKIETELETRFPDFYVASNDHVFWLPDSSCTVAVYPIAPEILRRDSSHLAGVPFLFYLGTLPIAEINECSRQIAKQKSVELFPILSRDRDTLIPAPYYFSRSDFDKMLEGTVKQESFHWDTKWPNYVEVIPGRTVQMDKLAKSRVPYSSTPYSWRNYGGLILQWENKDLDLELEGDYRRKIRFRSPSDYNSMVTTILPDVLAERAFIKEQQERQATQAAQLGNRVRALFGMYHPKTEAYTPRVAVHESWR